MALDTLVLQVVGTLASSLTAALLLWAVSILRDMRDTTESNERRSVRNARALDAEGILRPPATVDITTEYRDESRPNKTNADD